MSIRVLVVSLFIAALCGASGARAQTQILFTDGPQNSIRRMNTSGVETTELVNDTAVGDSLTGIVLARDGRLYVSSHQTDEILRYNLDGTGETVFAHNGNVAPGAAAAPGLPLQGPVGIAQAPDGDFYVASRYRNSIVRINGTTGQITAEIGYELVLSPEGIVVGSDGLYIAAGNDNAIYRLRFGSTSLETFISSNLNYPQGLAFGPDGNLYVSNYFSNSVVRFNATTGALVGTTVAATSGLQGPAGLLIDPASTTTNVILYVAANGEGRIYKVTNGGTPSKFAASRATFLTAIDTSTITAHTLSLTTAIGGCQTATGTVTISAPAPTGGTTINLSKQTTGAWSTAVTLPSPATVTIPAGQRSASYTITINTVTSTLTGTLRASRTSPTTNRDVLLTVRPVRLQSFTVAPASVLANQSGTVTVQRECALTSASSVTFSSSNTTAANAPATLSIPANQTTATTTILGKNVGSVQTTTVTANLGGGSKTVTFKVSPASAGLLASVAVNPTLVVGGSGRTSTGTVTLVTTATGNTTVTLSSSVTSAATVPASITIPANTLSATFTINTSLVTTFASPIITATANGASVTTRLDVVPLRVASLTITPATMISQSTATLTVTLTAAAPTGGRTVALSSSNALLPVPASITIPAGQTSASINVTAGSIGAATSSLVRASLNDSQRARVVNLSP